MLVEGKHTKEFAEKVEIIHQVGLQAEEEKKDEFDLDEHPELKERTTSRKSRPSHVKTISRDEFVEITEGEEEIRPPRAPVPVVNSPQNQPKLSPTEKQLVVLVQKNEKLEEENEKLKRETGKLQNLLRIKELAEEILELEESIS
jgi:hypothetical protein